LHLKIVALQKAQNESVIFKAMIHYNIHYNICQLLQILYSVVLHITG